MSVSLCLHGALIHLSLSVVPFNWADLNFHFINRICGKHTCSAYVYLLRWLHSQLYRFPYPICTRNCAFCFPFFFCSLVPCSLIIFAIHFWRMQTEANDKPPPRNPWKMYLFCYHLQNCQRHHSPEMKTMGENSLRTNFFLAHTLDFAFDSMFIGVRGAHRCATNFETALYRRIER